jgi:hypothetical protein
LIWHELIGPDVQQFLIAAAASVSLIAIALVFEPEEKVQTPLVV